MSDFTFATPQELNFNILVHHLVEKATRMWWESSTNLPDFERTYSPHQQAENEAYMARLSNGLIASLKNPPQTQAECLSFRQHLTDEIYHFGQVAFGFQKQQLEMIESYGFIEVSEEFARTARQFDPAISDEDIYQASRNVMTMNFLQLLLNLPVKLTPAIFAYSMLYPYTDNYIDDPGISASAKANFNQRFRQRLAGEPVQPANKHEETICALVAMIEKQFERSRYPQVYGSLLAIHDAQTKSLRLMKKDASPYEADVLEITFEKGGTSVLADGYLVAGSVTPQQAEFMFGYGAFTQLMDDLEDVQIDAEAGLMTVFSQTGRAWRLDGVTNRALDFGHRVFQSIHCFSAPDLQPLKDLLLDCIDPLMVDTVGRAKQYYSKEYLREIEKHLPFRFAPLAKQRQKLARQKLSLTNILNAITRPPAGKSDNVEEIKLLLKQVLPQSAK
jgi:hypothetical protein